MDLVIFECIEREIHECSREEKLGFSSAARVFDLGAKSSEIKSDF